MAARTRQGSAFNQPFGSTPGNPFGAQPPYGSQPPYWSQPPYGSAPFAGPLPRGTTPPFATAPPTRGRLVVTLAVLSATIVVAVVVLVAVIVVQGSGTVAGPPGTTGTATTSVPTPTAAQSSAEPTPEQSSASSPATTRTSSTSKPPSSGTPGSTSSTTPGGSTSTKPSGPYADHPELSASRLYQQQWSSWSCPTVERAEIPPGNAYKAWFSALLDCMMKRYEPVVTAAGGTLPRPEVFYFRRSATSPCGTSGDTGGFYCSANEAMYIDPVAMAEAASQGLRLAGVHVMFHEFSHHVQNRLDLLAIGVEVEDRYQVSRRLELQAECFTWSNLSLLPPSQWTARDLEDFTQWAGSDTGRTHGNAASRTYWFQRILGKGDLGLCNTWVAATDKVA